MSYLRQVLTLVEKDIIAELRTKEMFTSMFIFVLITMVIFNFAFGQEIEVNLTKIAAGILWVAFLFAAVLGLNRSFVHEKDEGCMDGLMLCPIDRTVIYVGKAIGNLIFITVVEVLTFPIFILFFMKASILSNLWLLFSIVMLSNLGITAIGTLLSAISINTRARDLMMPILFFPVIVPVLIAAVKSTSLLFASPRFSAEIYTWLKFLAIYDIIFLLISFSTFDYVLEE